jgi:hypothetical protein
MRGSAVKKIPSIPPNLNGVSPPASCAPARATAGPGRSDEELRGDCKSKVVSDGAPLRL